MSHTNIAHKDPRLPLAPALPDGPGWVSVLKVLDPGAAEALCAAVRTLYPHDVLSDGVYRRVVVALDQSAVKVPSTARLLVECVATLEAAFPVPFRDRSEGYRIAALKALEGTPAFRILQRSAVRFLYDDIEVWQAFGYEGAAHHLGGYLERGFDDLDWLPPVPPPVHR